MKKYFGFFGQIWQMVIFAKKKLVICIMVLSSSDFFEFLGGTRDVLKLWIFVDVYPFRKKISNHWVFSNGTIWISLNSRSFFFKNQKALMTCNQTISSVLIYMHLANILKLLRAVYCIETLYKAVTSSCAFLHSDKVTEDFRYHL